MQENNVKTRFLFIMLFLFSVLSTLWMMGTKNSFLFDDFSNLCLARFHTFEELFHIFPTRTYADRPMGFMFIKILNILFGLNYQIYHIIFAFIHYANIFLVYKIASILFNSIKGEEKKYLSILSAAIFGIYPISLMSVSWISAVYDLLCCLFVLLSMLFYLKARMSNRYVYNYAILSIMFFYLSIRTKEMSLTLPLIFIIYEIWLALRAQTRFRVNWYLIVNIVIMFLFVFLLFRGKTENVSPDNPYYQDFSIINLFRNAIRYLFLYFDWSNTGFAFYQYSSGAIVGVIFFLVILLYAIFLLIKKKESSLILLITCTGISLSVVLTMANMQHRLYLYIPSIFIGITISTFIYYALKTRIKYLWEISIVIIIGLYLINFMPGVIGLKSYWVNLCYNDAQSLKQLERIDKPVDNTNVYINGAKDSYNIFTYGPGNSLKIMYDEPSLNVFLVDEFPDKPVQPYLFLTYRNNAVSEVKRDMTIPLMKIEAVYPSQINKETQFNEDGSLDLAVVSEVINQNLKIVIDGVELTTVIGTDFMSTTIPKSFLEKDHIDVQVYDTKTGRGSETVSVKID